MNDEELRAFLDSATVGNDDDAKELGANPPESDEAAPEHATEAEAVPSRSVPTFDELMNMPRPDAVASPAHSSPDGSPAPRQAPTPVPPVVVPSSPAEAAGVPQPTAPQPTAPQPTAPQPTAPQPTATQQDSEWSPAYAQDNEQLVPLILPGFSSEPSTRRDLPPVFQAEPTAPQQPEAPHVDPAPTQPFDVLSDAQEFSKAEESEASSGAAVDAVATGIGANATSSTTSQAAAVATTPIVAKSRPADNPFAMLAPDLVAPDEEIDEYERISVVGGEPRGRKALPWLIVGGGVVVAIIASIFVINGVRSTEMPAATEPPPATSAPAPSETTTPTPSPSEEPEPEPEPNAAPVVDPGSTWVLPISQWGMTVDVSDKLGGSTPYTLFDGDSRMMFDSLPVAAGISDACAAARAEHAWGLLKKDDGKLEVIRPEPRCTSPSDAAVYDTIWGVLDYMAKSVKTA